MATLSCQTPADSIGGTHVCAGDYSHGWYQSLIVVLKGRIPTPFSVQYQCTCTPSKDSHSLQYQYTQRKNTHSIQYQCNYRKDTHFILCPISVYSLKRYQLQSLPNIILCPINVDSLERYSLYSLSNIRVIIGKIPTPFSVQYQCTHWKYTYSTLCPIAVYSLERCPLHSLSNISPSKDSHSIVCPISELGKIPTPFSVQIQCSHKKDAFSILCPISVYLLKRYPLHSLSNKCVPMEKITTS